MKFKTTLFKALEQADASIDGYDVEDMYSLTSGRMVLERADEEKLVFADSEIEIDSGQALLVKDHDGEAHTFNFTVTRMLEEKDMLP